MTGTLPDREIAAVIGGIQVGLAIVDAGEAWIKAVENIVAQQVSGKTVHVPFAVELPSHVAAIVAFDRGRACERILDPEEIIHGVRITQFRVYPRDVGAKRLRSISLVESYRAEEARRRIEESGVLERFDDRHGPNVLEEVAG